MAVTVRLLAASEWRLWRDVALQSLADSPDAFRPTLAESNDQPEEFWRGAVAPTVEHERSNLWVAVNGDDPVGKLYATIDEDFTTVYIGAMWVAPDLRGAGVGRRLMQAAEEWGKDSGVTRSELWVTETNQAAVHFYQSLDYVPTDDTQMLREGSGLVVRAAENDLTCAPARCPAARDTLGRTASPRSRPRGGPPSCRPGTALPVGGRPLVIATQKPPEGIREPAVGDTLVVRRTGF